MVKVVTVKFKDGGKPYYFAPGKDEYQKGAGVIVETAKGLEYATVWQGETEVEDDKVVSPLKPIIRLATKKDEEQVARNLAKRDDALKTAREKIAARGLDMKLVDCEFAFDGSKVAFFFTSETRVDFRELIKDLSSAFHMRIELRQINIRDEIKLTGGLAPCGRPCCCIGSIQEPKKVSVKMAKNQGLSLNPSKISGLCGRLMCCLAYENDFYSELCKKVPKLGSEAETPDGKGIVVNVNMLKMTVKVKIEANDAVSYHDYSVDQIRFMRGNVVMGNENLGEDEEQEETEELQTEEPTAEQAEEEKSAPQERRDRRDKFRKGGNNDGRNDAKRGDNKRQGGQNVNRGQNNFSRGQNADANGERQGENRNDDRRGNRPNRNQGGNGRANRANGGGNQGGNPAANGNRPFGQGQAQNPDGERRGKRHGNRHGGQRPPQNRGGSDGGNGGERGGN